MTSEEGCMLVILQCGGDSNFAGGHFNLKNCENYENLIISQPPRKGGKWNLIRLMDESHTFTHLFTLNPGSAYWEESLVESIDQLGTDSAWNERKGNSIHFNVWNIGSSERNNSELFRQQTSLDRIRGQCVYYVEPDIEWKWIAEVPELTSHIIG